MSLTSGKFEEKYNEQFQQGMIDQFQCIQDSDFIHGSEYLDEYYDRIYDIYQRQLHAAAQQHPNIAAYVNKYYKMISNQVNQYIGTSA
ncbi:hypothetical protein KDRO_B03800 [Kluyveromyces lactis]|nr:hypothetical protein KDRO_B03800 [Kluyveromyces lactis]